MSRTSILMSDTSKLRGSGGQRRSQPFAPSAAATFCRTDRAAFEALNRKEGHESGAAARAAWLQEHGADASPAVRGLVFCFPNALAALFMPFAAVSVVRCVPGGSMLLPVVQVLPMCCLRGAGQRCTVGGIVPVEDSTRRTKFTSVAHGDWLCLTQRKSLQGPHPAPAGHLPVA